jgi:hypothetical protein
VKRADVPAAKIVWTVAPVHPGPFDVDEAYDSVEVYYRNAFGCLFSNGREIPKPLSDLFMFRHYVIHPANPQLTMDLTMRAGCSPPQGPPKGRKSFTF